jgi:Sulfotransferase domain
MLATLALLNTWTPPGIVSPGPEELRAYVLCDGCLPPPAMSGSAGSLARLGWRFDDLLAGPHRCPSCAYRGVGAERRRRSPESARPALPNLIVIGATKAATTAVHAFLGEHPDIDMAADKELNFFLHPEAGSNLDTYATYFDGGSPLRGESSPLYTYDLNLPGVPASITEALPDARLIYLVRDPVDRALSDYVHYAAQWGEPEDGFEHPDHPYNVFVTPSRYARQLEAVLDHFPREQVLVVDQAELLGDGHATMAAIFRFVGAEDSFTSPLFSERVNPAEGRRRMTRLGRSMRASPLATALGRLPSGPRERLLKAARRLMLRAPDGGGDPDPELRERLRETLAADAARLRELTGRRFPTWQV